MALTFRKNIGFALLGNLFYAGSQYLILLIFIKFLAKDDVGVFVYASAFTAPLMLALDMQMRNFYITDRNQDFDFTEYYSFRVFNNLIGVVLLMAASLILRPEYFNIVLLITVIKVFDSQLDVIYGVYQKNHSLNFVAYSRILRGLLSMLAVVASIFFFKSLEVAILSLVISSGFLYFFYDRRRVIYRNLLSAEEFRLKIISKRNAKRLLILGAPMFATIFIDKYYLNYPRLSVESKLGVNSLAIFGSLLYFKALGGQIIAAIAQSAIPKLTDYLKIQNYHNFNKLIIKMILAGFSIGAGLTIFSYFGGKYLIAILYTIDYADYDNVLVLLLMGATITFSYIFLATALTCLRKQWVKLPLVIISFLILFTWISIEGFDSLEEISRIILNVEGIAFLMYLGVYGYFFRKQKQNLNGSSII